MKKMNKWYRLLCLILTALTVVGCVFVLINHGQVSAGYACVPMVLTLAAYSGYWTKHNKK